MKISRLLKFSTFFLAFIACATIPSDGLDAGNSSEVDRLRPLLRVPVQVTVGNDANFAPDISLDGRYLVHTTSINGNKEVVLKDRKKKMYRLLTNHAADDFAPALSPDGKMVAFLTRRLDAAGDIAFTGIDRPVFSLAVENELKVASKPDSEELAPAWFPDSKRLIVPVRDDPRQTPKLFILNMEDLKWQDLGVRGEYPNISNEGLQLVYVREAKIRLYDIVRGQESELKGLGSGVWARPRFTQTPGILVAVRYADDTNHDGALDGSDHGTIWRFPVPASSSLFQKPTQLTSASLNAFLPELRKDALYVTLEAKGALEIFKLPPSGQTRTEWDTVPEDQWLWNFKDPYDRYFALNAMAESAEAVGKRARAIELRLRALEERLDHASQLEMNIALEDALRGHDNDPDMQRLVGAFRLLAAILPDLSALENGTANTFARKRMQDAVVKIDDFEKQIRPQSREQTSLEVSAYLNVKKAQILLKLGDIKGANAKLISVEKNASPRTTALAKLVEADIVGAAKNYEGRENLLLVVAKSQPTPTDMKRRAADAYVKSLTDRKIDAEAFERARQVTKDIPFVPSLLHVEIAKRFLRERKFSVGVNEYRQILIEHCKEDPQFVPEIAAEYVSLAMTYGGIEVVDETLNEAAKCIDQNQMASIEMKQVRARALIAYGQRLMRDREYGHALKLFRQATTVDSANLAGWRGLVDSSWRRKVLPELKKDFDQTLKSKPNDLVAAYGRGYVETYAVDDAKSPGDKIAAVDRGIALISHAQELDPTQIFPHQTLGWLYMQRAHWVERMRKDGGVRGRVSSIWSKLRDFIGRPEDNDVELAVDSFQASLFLAEERSQERANIIQNLAEAYYQLENHQKALTYYVERIKLSKELPFSDAGSEASVLRLAGRSAFQVDELDLAEELQRRALVIWKDQGNDGQISYSLDALALTLREQKKYDEAILLYQEIYERHRAAKRSHEAQQSLSNKAYCFYMAGKYEESLKTFLESDNLPIEADSQQKSEQTSNAIAVDVGGEASAAKGFDDTARKNMNFTFEARIFENLGRLEEASMKYREKIKLLQDAVDDANAGKKKSLTEEIVIVRNNLGWIETQSGKLLEASKEFQAAMIEAKNLRLPGQSLSRDEVVNASAWARVLFRLKVAKKTPSPELKNIVDELKKMELVARPTDPKASLTPDMKQILAQLTTLRTAVEASLLLDETQQAKLLSTDLALAATYTPDEKNTLRSRETALLALDVPVNEVSGALADQMRDVRKSSFDDANPELSWRAKIAAWKQTEMKLKGIEQAVMHSVILQTSHDRVAVLDEYIHAFDQADSDEAKIQVLRGFFRVTSLSSLNQMARGALAEHRESATKRIVSIKNKLNLKTTEEFKKATTADDRIVVVLDDGSVYRIAYFTAVKGWQVETGTDFSKNIESLVKEAKKIYFSCNGPRCLQTRNQLTSKDQRLSSIATPEMIPRLTELRRLPMSSLLIEAAKNQGAEDAYKSVLSTHDVRLVQGKSWADLRSLIPEAHIVAFALPLKIGAESPSTGQLLMSDVATPDVVTGLPIASIVGQNPWFATGIIMPRIELGSVDNDINAIANYISLWLLEREVPTALLKVRAVTDLLKPSSIEYATTISSEIQSQVSMNTLTPAAGYLMAGDPGLFDEEAKIFAAKHLNETREKALDAKDDGDVASAKRLFMEAAHYAKILGQDADALSLYESLIKLLFQAQEYQAAERFQAQKIDLLKKSKATPRVIAAAQMEAGILAIRASAPEPARKYLAEAEKFYIAEDEDLDLAKIHHYYGLAFEIESNFEGTLKEYEISRTLFQKGDDRAQAAQKLLDIGNIHKERLGNFPLALEFYNRAHDEFSKIKMVDRLPKVQIDRANTLMAMGETRWAINVMENRVLNVVTAEQDPALWMRASQITANAYYQAGLFGDSQKFIAQILKKSSSIKDPAQRTTTEIDAKNLDAMILEKLGRHTDAMKIFDEILAEARKYRLRGKEALILNNMGYWNREAGEVQTSISQFKEALAIDEAVKSEADQAYDLRNLGLSLTLLGDLVQAKSVVERALKISSKLKLAYNEAYSLFAMAEIAERQEKHEEAIQFFELARKGAEKAFLQDFIWRAFAAIGFVKAKKGDYASAIGDLASAIVIIERLRAGLTSESSKTGFASDRGVQDVYAEIVLVLMKQNRIIEAWQYSERGRARAFIDAMGGRALAFGDKDLDAILAQERELRSTVELDDRRIALLPPSSPDEPKAKEIAAQHKDEYKKLLAVISAKWPKVMPFLGVRPMNIEDVSQKIGKDSGLLEYMVLHDATAYWVVENGVMKGGLLPTGRERIRVLIDQYRELMQNFAAVSIPGKELANILLVEPLKILTTTKKLVIVPHSELHYLPFAALPVAEGYLLDKFPISYLESAEMLRFAPEPLRVINSKSRLLAFGNPDRGPDLNLPFAEREVRALTRSFPNIKAFLGKDATLEEMKLDIGKADMFHFAGHGEFSTTDPSSSRLLFAGDETKGDLTVKNIITMKIPAALVTLSACETGLGKLTSGDDIVGFNRAFFFAGTESLVTSLWRISDVASSVTVKRFYTGLSKGVDRATALRDAQQIVKKYYPHPAYWSAFKLSGVAN